MKVRKIFTSSYLKRALGTLLPPLVIAVTLPAVILIYLLLILSIPLLRHPLSIPDYIVWVCIGLYAGLIPIIFHHLVNEGSLSERWYHYISELTSSVFVLTASLGLLLTETGLETLEQTSVYIVDISPSMIRVLLLIMFVTLGVLFANIYFLYPKIRSFVENAVSILRSAILPPYEVPGTSTQSLNQTSLDQDKMPYAFFIGGICLFSIWLLPVLPQSEEEVIDLIEGHITLIGYFRDLLSIDPEKTIEGLVGPIEEIVVILDPAVFGIYLVILILALTFAKSWIYLARLFQERIRRHFELSRMGITAISTSLCIPLLSVSWIISESVIFSAWVIISQALA